MSAASLYPTEYSGRTRDSTNVSYVQLSSPVTTSKSLSSLSISTIMNAQFSSLPRAFSGSAALCRWGHVQLSSLGQRSGLELGVLVPSSVLRLDHCVHSARHTSLFPHLFKVGAGLNEWFSSLLKSVGPLEAYLLRNLEPLQQNLTSSQLCQPSVWRIRSE